MNLQIKLNSMKTNKYFLTLAGFIAGTICGVSLISMVAFTAPGAPGIGNTAVSSTDANTFLKSYLAGATVNNQVI